MTRLTPPAPSEGSISGSQMMGGLYLGIGLFCLIVTGRLFSIANKRRKDIVYSSDYIPFTAEAVLSLGMLALGVSFIVFGALWLDHANYKTTSLAKKMAEQRAKEELLEEQEDEELRRLRSLVKNQQE